VLASSRSDSDGTESVSSLDVVTHQPDVSASADPRFAQLTHVTSDFYNTIALLPGGSDFQPLSIDDIVDVSRWIHMNVGQPEYAQYISTIRNLTTELSSGNISPSSDWRILSMMSSHVSIIPIIDFAGSIFHVSNHLRLVWRRIANNTPLPFTEKAMSILRSGLNTTARTNVAHSNSKLIIDFTLAFFRCIDGQLVPVDQLNHLVKIGQSMNGITAAATTYNIETRNFFAYLIQSEMDIEQVNLMGRWHVDSDISVDYVLFSAFDRLSRMKDRFDQLERAIDILWDMGKFFEVNFGTIPQPIIGGSPITTIQSTKFLNYLFHSMNQTQLHKYLEMSSDIILGLNGSFSTWMTVNGALELGLVDDSRALSSLMENSSKKATSAVIKFDKTLQTQWLTGLERKSVWERDITGTLLNASILVRILGAETANAALLIRSVKLILAAMNGPTRDEASITLDLVIPCKRTINRIIQELLY